MSRAMSRRWRRFGASSVLDARTGQRVVEAAAARASQRHWAPWPSIAEPARSLLEVQPRDRAEQADGVRMLRLGEERRAPARARRPAPAYITTTSSAISAITPRSCVMRMIAVPSLRAQRAHQLQDLRLDGDVERGGGLVGDQEPRVAGQRHRDHHALAHAARELVRIVVRSAARATGCAPGAASRSRCVLRFRSCRLRRDAAGAPSTIWSPTVKAGFSEVIGSWKIIAMPRAAQLAQPRRRQLQQVARLRSAPRRRRCARAAAAPAP